MPDRAFIYGTELDMGQIKTTVDTDIIDLADHCPKIDVYRYKIDKIRDEADNGRLHETFRGFRYIYKFLFPKLTKLEAAYLVNNNGQNVRLYPYGDNTTDYQTCKMYVNKMTYYDKLLRNIIYIAELETIDLLTPDAVSVIFARSRHTALV